MARLALTTAALAGFAASGLAAQGSPPMDHAAHAAQGHPGAAHAAHGDAGRAAMQERGKQAMGVDQYTSVHRFDALPDGGRIELQRETDDSAGTARIREHMREIAAAFSRGDFTTPLMVHAAEVPGTRVMTARRQYVTYVAHDLPRGGEVRITTHDAAALRAIAEFMAFQRREHQAGGVGE